MRLAALLVALAVGTALVALATTASAHHGPFCYQDLGCCDTHEGGSLHTSCTTCVAIGGAWDTHDNRCHL